MISRIRNSAFIRILWGVMGIYLLNISVDTADPQPEHIPEDLSFNDQESFIEIIVEQVLGYENAIKEYDDHDTEEHNKKKNLKIDLMSKVSNMTELSPAKFILINQNYTDNEALSKNPFLEIDSPPPKA